LTKCRLSIRNKSDYDIHIHNGNEAAFLCSTPPAKGTLSFFLSTLSR